MPTVFISYRHENDAHSKRVEVLARKLRDEHGITVIFDVFTREDNHGNQPPNGWSLWSVQHASTCASAVIIASDGWFAALNSSQPIDTGLGAAAEASTIFQRLYTAGTVNEFAVIIHYGSKPELASLPPYLDLKCGRFDLSNEDDIHRLVMWLNRPPPSVAPKFAFVNSSLAEGVSSPHASIKDPFPELVPKVDRSNYVNCSVTFQAYESLLARGSPARILLVGGEGEHGKSTLLKRFFYHATENLPPCSIGFVRFASAPARSPSDLLAQLVDDFEMHSVQGKNEDEQTRAFFEARKGRPTVVFFDAYEHVEPQHAYWVHLFLEKARRVAWLRCIIAGRRVPEAGTSLWGPAALQVECDALAEPAAMVEHLAARFPTVARETLTERITAVCELLRHQRVLGHSGASPKMALDFFEKLWFQPKS